jgi:hypothetical protein
VSILLRKMELGNTFSEGQNGAVFTISFKEWVKE